MTYYRRDSRVRGRNGQERRKRIWSRDPFCAMCGKLVVLTYPDPSAFELDHIVALANGGKDIDSNLQVLCAGPMGCHAKKTARDLGHTAPRVIGLDGFPIEVDEVEPT